MLARLTPNDEPHARSSGVAERQRQPGSDFTPGAVSSWQRARHVVDRPTLWSEPSSGTGRLPAGEPAVKANVPPPCFYFTPSFPTILEFPLWGQDRFPRDEDCRFEFRSLQWRVCLSSESRAGAGLASRRDEAGPRYRAWEVRRCPVSMAR
jgi:hypothetical protein